MLRLYILRHAKSSWATPGQKDFDRPLNDQGAADLPLMAAALQQKGYLARHIYCSPALRTRVTLHGVMAAYKEQPPAIDYRDDLYSGDLSSYVEAVRQHSPGDAVMLIGHNPMCEATASTLAGNGDAQAMADLRRKYPTGALAVIDFDIASWTQMKPGNGYLSDFVTPRALRAD
jgi:phosphohistidine phosphatase